MAEFTLHRLSNEEIGLRVHSWGHYTSISVRLPTRPVAVDPVHLDDDDDAGGGAVEIDPHKRSPSPPHAGRKRRVVVEDDDSEDDGGFDEEAYNRDGRAMLAKQSEKLAHATASPRQAFDWYLDYVVRASLSAKWQEKAAEDEDPALAHLFSPAATRAWDAYTHTGELAASEAWGRPGPFDADEQGADEVTARVALDAFPRIRIEKVSHGTRNATCWACSRKRTPSVQIALLGTPYSEEYVECAAPLSDLHTSIADAKKQPTVLGGEFLIGSECAERIQAYHNARHWLHHLIEKIVETGHTKPENVLTDEFREKMWQESESVLQACRAYAVEGKKTRASSRRYGRRVEYIDGEELDDDE